MGENGSWVQNLPKVVELRVAWNYSWGSDSIQHLQPSFIRFVPMVWGYWGDDAALWDEVRSIEKLQNASMILTFNEPDHKDQSNLTVDQVLPLWHVFESANLPLVSPSCANPLGDWMEEFMEEAARRNYRVDIIGVHSYGGPNPREFQHRLEKIYEKYRRPILITEFAVADWDAKTTNDNRYSVKQVMTFMEIVLPWLEEQDWIIGYAWFPFSINSAVGTSSALFDNNGDFTSCGKFYADYGVQSR